MLCFNAVICVGCFLPLFVLGGELRNVSHMDVLRTNLTASRRMTASFPTPLTTTCSKTALFPLSIIYGRYMSFAVKFPTVRKFPPIEDFRKQSGRRKFHRWWQVVGIIYFRARGDKFATTSPFEIFALFCYCVK